MTPMEDARSVAGLSCFEIVKLLSDYLDGDLAEDTAAQVGRHLQGCPNCGRFGVEISGMLASLANQSPDVTDEIAARLKLALFRRFEGVPFDPD